MTVILPEDYHARSALEDRRVECISREAALRQDIRPLRIGILNIMPRADTYEFNLLFPLGRSILQIIPVWLRLESHAYHSTDKAHLDKLYISFQQAIEQQALDGLILTGAPVEKHEFEQVTYWDEIQEIVAYAWEHIPSTLGLCWGGLALARWLGMEKVRFDEKLFGVFETRRLVRDHPIAGDLDDIFWCPQSRYCGIPDDVLERERDAGRLNLLAASEPTGYTIFETVDHRLLMHLGHPEYNSGRLIAELERDRAQGLTDVPAPANFDPDHPVNRWRSHRNEFFNAWIKYVYLTTEY
jgi:homoserine O-succinyltransferase